MVQFLHLIHECKVRLSEVHSVKVKTADIMANAIVS